MASRMAIDTVYAVWCGRRKGCFRLANRKPMSDQKTPEMEIRDIICLKKGFVMGFQLSVTFT